MRGTVVQVGEIVVERSVLCLSSAEALWPKLTDTERLNRAIGLGRIELVPNDDATAARFVVKTVSGGFPLVYEERPYEWAAPETFRVRRVVRKGMVASLEHAFSLAPSPSGGTSVSIKVAVAPKSPLIAPVVRFQVGRFVGKLAGYVAALDAELVSARESRDISSRVDLARLARLEADLRGPLTGEERDAAERVVALVRGGDDPAVDRIRPYELARAWGLPRRAVLGACLEAVRAGVLELTWDLVCPSCRTATERLRALSVLEAHAHCQVCDISYDLDLDRAVEATFRPPRDLRALDEGPYCIGGPARTPHVLVQALLPALGSASVRAPEVAGRYRLFVRGGPASILRVTEGADEALSAVAKLDGATPAQADVAPRGTITVSSELEGERHLKIERVDFADDAATAHDLSLLPGFRKQFARELLRPGLTLRIARVTLLFSDLTGSTALYETIGDARAFGFVQDHFDLLGGLVSSHGGAVVKTIGDAVMAAFGSEEDAVRAAAEMHTRFPSVRAGHTGAERVRLKIGVFAGPCYVVTANGALDYFGHTVNVAARLQGEALPGEIVTTHEVATLADREGWAAGQPFEPFEARLKGVVDTMRLGRFRVDG